MHWTKSEEPKAFPELTFDANSITVPQDSSGSRDTPFLDESRPEFDANPDRQDVNRLLGHCMDSPSPPGKGVLGDCAVALLMKLLYGARMGQYDLIRPAQALASLTTTWDGLCDKKLHRLVCNINSTLDLNLYGWIGDHILTCSTWCCIAMLISQAIALTPRVPRGCLCVCWDHVPLCPLMQCPRNRPLLLSRPPEAEIVSFHRAVYKRGLPALSMWDYTLGRGSCLRVMEDNNAAIRIIVSGHNPNMRHTSRTQRIDISALNERYDHGGFLKEPKGVVP